MQKYDQNCLKEAETVAALERVIEDLRQAHSDSVEEIGRLSSENKLLMATLGEAEDYVKRYSSDNGSEVSKMKNMLGEVNDLNAALLRKAKKSDDALREMKEEKVEVECKLKDANVRQDRLQECEAKLKDHEIKVNEMESLLFEKQNDISVLQDELSS